MFTAATSQETKSAHQVSRAENNCASGVVEPGPDLSLSGQGGCYGKVSHRMLEGGFMQNIHDVVIAGQDERPRMVAR